MSAVELNYSRGAVWADLYPEFVWSVRAWGWPDATPCYIGARTGRVVPSGSPYRSESTDWSSHEGAEFVWSIGIDESVEYA